MNLKSINKYWPIIGGGIATVIVITVAVLWNKSETSTQLSLLFWLNLAVLMLHEFEEYVLPGGFKYFINHKSVLGVTEPEGKEPISDTVIVLINLGAWAFFILAIILARITPWMGVGMILFNVVNILGHLIIFQVKSKGYNPGLITAVLMIPFLIFAFKFVFDNQILNTVGLILAIVIGIIAGGSLPIAGVIVQKKAAQH